MTTRGDSTAPGPVRASRPERVAAATLWVELLAIAGVLVFYGVETLRGETNNLARAVMSMVTIALLGAFVAFVARALARGHEGGRVPAIVWSVFLLPVGFDLTRGGQALFGIPMLALAITTITCCALAYRTR